MKPTEDGPKNACSAKWCDVCARREKREREAREEEKAEMTNETVTLSAEDYQFLMAQAQKAPGSVRDLDRIWRIRASAVHSEPKASFPQLALDNGGELVVETCPTCYALVPEDRMTAHMDQVHTFTPYEGD